MMAYEKYAQLREQKGVNDLRVATDTGMSPSTLYDWKAGRYTPKADKLVALAAYFEVPIDYFLKEA